MRVWTAPPAPDGGADLELPEGVRMPAPVDAAVRAAVEAELVRGTDRSRAAIAREAGVSTRTVQRWAEALGLTDPWSTADTAAATAAATDRRRALRSQLADELLQVEVPMLRERMRTPMRKTILVGRGMGEQTPELVDEDDAVVARGLQSLITSVGIAVDKTIAIDKHDHVDAGDDAAGELLGKLFDGLGAAYAVLQAEGDAPVDELGEVVP